MNESHGYDVFVSYSSHDEQQARWLVPILVERGWSVFWDREAIRGGDNFVQVINEHLVSASCVVTLWSHRSVASAWVLSEAEVARKANKLVPALISSVDIPPPFTVYHTVDLTSWSGEAASGPLTEFLDQLSSYVDRSERPRAFPEPAGASVAPAAPSKLSVIGRMKTGSAPDQIEVVDHQAWLLSESSDWLRRYDLKSGRLEGEVALDSGPTGLAFSEDLAWVSCGESGELLALDRFDASIVTTVQIGESLGAPALYHDRVWVPTLTGTHLVGVDPSTGEIVLRVAVGRQPFQVFASDSHVWVLNAGDRTVSVVDPVSGSVVDSYGLGRAPRSGLRVGDALWFADGITGDLTIVGGGSAGGVVTVPLGSPVLKMVLADSGVWVASHASGSVFKVDPVTLAVATVTSDLARPSALGVVGDLVVASDSADGTVSVFGPAGVLIERVRVGQQLVDMAALPTGEIGLVDYSAAELVLVGTR